MMLMTLLWITKKRILGLERIWGLDELRLGVEETLTCPALPASLLII